MMRVALVATAVLLVLSIGLAQLHIEPKAHWGSITLAGIAIVTALFLFFGHIELALAAIAPVALTFTATLGTLGWLATPITRSDILVLQLCLVPALSLSMVLLGARTRIYRGQSPASPWLTASQIVLALLVIATLRFAPIRHGETSKGIGVDALMTLIGGAVAVWLILPPLATLLLPDGRNRPARGLGKSNASNALARTRSLYRYLDIPAERYVTWKLRLDPIFGRFEEAAPKSGVILDAGCGFGIMSNLLAMQSAFRTVTGIDQDERKLRVARRAARTLGNVHYVSGDLIDIDYPPADCVLLIDALHYWSAEKQSRIIASCAACLRPGGLLIFRESMRDESAGHRVVHWAERGAVWLGHNPRGDGLSFQTRDFYLREFARHGLDLESGPTDWGHGSNAVLILKNRAAQHKMC